MSIEFDVNEFHRLLGEYTQGILSQDMDAEDLGILRGKMTALMCKTRVVQVDDPLIEVYRLALAHGAPAEHLCDILKMIQERDHV